VDDADLARRLAARDQGALAELHRRFAPFVYAIASRISRDRTTAEDVTQEVFLRVWQQSDRFDPERGSMRAWLGTLTHHAAVAWIRRQVAAHRREELHADATHAEADDRGDVVERTVLARLSAARVRRALAALPPAQREAIELAYGDGLTYRDVAAETGVPEGTAKSRLRRALASMAITLR
jgi:RNA polymerase sigma-70 factor (ECF subfamily)